MNSSPNIEFTKAQVPRRLFNAYPDRTVAVPESSNISIEVDLPVLSEHNGDREGPGLRSHDNQTLGGSSDCNLALPHSFGGRQHDLSESNRKTRIQRTKTTLASLFQSVASVLTGLSSTSTTFSSSRVHSLAQQTNVEPSPLADPLILNRIMTDRDRLVADALRDSAHLNSSMQPYDPAVVTPDTTLPFSIQTTANARNQARMTRTSAFCPCFSPTISDDSESEDERSNSAVGWSVARDLRQRLAVVADANNQPARGRVIGHISQCDEPIHTTVQYANYLVKDMDKIFSATYYWGVMDRFEAERLLEGKPEGTFLLRDSAQTEYLFSVSFRRYQRTLHARIEQSNHRFGFDIHDASVYSAPSITELIENYKDPSRCLFFEPQLTHPLHRSFVFSLQQLCRAKIAANTTYTKVSELGLPPKLKQYIREIHYMHRVRTTVYD